MRTDSKPHWNVLIVALAYAAALLAQSPRPSLRAPGASGDDAFERPAATSVRDAASGLVRAHNPRLGSPVLLAAPRTGAARAAVAAPIDAAVSALAVLTPASSSPRGPPTLL